MAASFCSACARWVWIMWPRSLGRRWSKIGGWYSLLSGSWEAEDMKVEKFLGWSTGQGMRDGGGGGGCWRWSPQLFRAFRLLRCCPTSPCVPCHGVPSVPRMAVNLPLIVCTVCATPKPRDLAVGPAAVSPPLYRFKGASWCFDHLFSYSSLFRVCSLST